MPSLWLVSGELFSLSSSVFQQWKRKQGKGASSCASCSLIRHLFVLTKRRSNKVVLQQFQTKRKKKGGWWWEELESPLLINFELALGLLVKFGELRKFVWFSGSSKEGVKRGPIQTYFSIFHSFHFSKPSGWFQHQSELANMGNFSSIIWMWEISSIHKLWKVISSSYNCELKGSWCHWISFNEGYAHASGWLLGNNS